MITIFMMINSLVKRYFMFKLKHGLSIRNYARVSIILMSILPYIESFNTKFKNIKNKVFSFFKRLIVSFIYFIIRKFNLLSDIRNMDIKDDFNLVKYAISSDRYQNDIYECTEKYTDEHDFRTCEKCYKHSQYLKIDDNYVRSIIMMSNLNGIIKSVYK